MVFILHGTKLLLCFTSSQLSFENQYFHVYGGCMELSEVLWSKHDGLILRF